MAEIDTILNRIARGDREALQKFIARYESRIRRRIRGKLAGWDRRICDTDDIFVSACRRLDMLLLAEKLPTQSLRALEQFVIGTAVRITQEKNRRSLRDRRLSHRLQNQCRSNRDVQPSIPSDDIADAVLREISVSERELLMIWVHSGSHAHAANALTLAITTWRKRWNRLQRKLHAHTQSSLHEQAESWRNVVPIASERRGK